MKKYNFLALAFLFSFISCSSELKDEETNNVDSDDVIVEDGNSLLWKIEGKGCVTSYMYGTMHMIEAPYYNMTQTMMDKIQSSKAIIMEVDGMPNPIESFNMMSLDSGTVHQYFTKDQMAQILEFFDQELDTSPESFHRLYGPMKPFFILQAMTQGYFEGETKSYDLDIMAMAGTNDIPIVGLETIQEQLGFFDIISQEEMAGMIMEGIENFEKEKKDTKKMMKIYHSQKVEKLIPLMNKQSPELMQFSDIFLYDRNKRWIPKIEKEISDKQCFIAVGAGHLFGEGGVIDLLEKEGYTLTAISTE
ncbi:MAG: TraB/GumN family protein [Flavobacteriales bacterium]|jgi:uncharacterized protein YbaP (TraB family)|nr:TraB/GumN family protein [Flavobacteriales bacterium]